MAGIALLKDGYIKYFQDVPVQKYAAMSIGRDEDTIIRCIRDDQAFADAVQRAKAEWVSKKMLAVKAEFALERLEKDLFAQRGEVDALPQRTGSARSAEVRAAFKDLLVEKIRPEHQQS